MKMTRRSSSSEAKTRMSWRTLRQVKRHSKSTCSSRESVGRRSSSTCRRQGSAAEGGPPGLREAPRSGFPSRPLTCPQSPPSRRGGAGPAAAPPSPCQRPGPAPPPPPQDRLAHLCRDEAGVPEATPPPRFLPEAPLASLHQLGQSPSQGRGQHGEGPLGPHSARKPGRSLSGPDLAVFLRGGFKATPRSQPWCKGPLPRGRHEGGRTMDPGVRAGGLLPWGRLASPLAPGCVGPRGSLGLLRAQGKRPPPLGPRAICPPSKQARGQVAAQEPPCGPQGGSKTGPRRPQDLSLEVRLHSPARGEHAQPLAGGTPRQSPRASAPAPEAAPSRLPQPLLRSAGPTPALQHVPSPAPQGAGSSRE